MQSEVQKQNFTYDVFLSYSRRDIEFVMAFEKALNEYVPAAGQYRLNIFRDDGKTTGNEYYRSIERALRQSRKLILVASPNSYKSQFVNDEVRDFIRMKGARNVFVILLDGAPNNEVQPGQEALKAFPEVLCEVMRMPLAVDYRGFDPAQANLTTGRYQHYWFRILKYIYDEDLPPVTREPWDIFISYAPADVAFAGNLEKELEKYAPPKDLALELNLPARHLKVFREEDYATRDDNEAIRWVLENSQKMILLCSPASRDDKHVKQQVAQFVGLQGAESIIPILVAGEPDPDIAKGAFPAELCQWINEPLYIDYRGFKLGKDKISDGVYSGHWATLLAIHYQVNRAEIERYEQDRRKGNLWFDESLNLVKQVWKTTPKQRIFINYRRDDSPGDARSLYGTLSKHFGKKTVFWDIGEIEIGEDFVEKIQSEVETCKILIALIGKQWLTCADNMGKRRLDNPGDFVRLEISSALASKIRVIPVLLHGAKMPGEDELPDVLKPLARRNALELNNQNWDSGLEKLIAAIDKYHA